MRLDEAGIRTPRHARAHTADQCREAAEDIGYPLILKPIAGAGSQDTYRVDDAGELEDALARLGHIAEVSIEEYIDGRELYVMTSDSGLFAIEIERSGKDRKGVTVYRMAKGA